MTYKWNSGKFVDPDKDYPSKYCSGQVHRPKSRSSEFRKRWDQTKFQLRGFSFGNGTQGSICWVGSESSSLSNIPSWSRWMAWSRCSNSTPLPSLLKYLAYRPLSSVDRVIVMSSQDQNTSSILFITRNSTRRAYPLHAMRSLCTRPKGWKRSLCKWEGACWRYVSIHSNDKSLLTRSAINPVSSRAMGIRPIALFEIGSLRDQTLTW